MPGDGRRVVANAVDEARVAAALKLHAEHIQPRYRSDATGVDDLAARIEDRDVQPRVRPTVAGGPDDGVDPLGGKMQVIGRRPGERPRRPERLGLFGGDAVLR